MDRPIHRRAMCEVIISPWLYPWPTLVPDLVRYREQGLCTDRCRNHDEGTRHCYHFVVVIAESYVEPSRMTMTTTASREVALSHPLTHCSLKPQLAVPFPQPPMPLPVPSALSAPS